MFKTTLYQSNFIALMWKAKNMQVSGEMVAMDESVKKHRILIEFYESCQIHASTINESKEFLQEETLNLLINDPPFSKANGLPFIKKVKDHSPSTRIITISPCSIHPCKSRCKKQCLSLGADCHLEKMEGLGKLTEKGIELLDLPESYVSYSFSFWRSPKNPIIYEKKEKGFEILTSENWKQGLEILNENKGVKYILFRLMLLNGLDHSKNNANQKNNNMEEVS